jgi:hypothetical protein
MTHEPLKTSGLHSTNARVRNEKMFRKRGKFIHSAKSDNTCNFHCTNAKVELYEHNLVTWRSVISFTHGSLYASGKEPSTTRIWWWLSPRADLQAEKKISFPWRDLKPEIRTSSPLQMEIDYRYVQSIFFSLEMVTAPLRKNRYDRSSPSNDFGTGWHNKLY